MARDDAPFFARGETAYNGGTINAADLVGANWEGQTRVFEDINLASTTSPGAKPTRSNRPVKCMCVRNVSGIPLLPRRLVVLKKSGVNFLGQVDGYVLGPVDQGYPVDEYLPAAGVPNNDLFWIVIDGPATVLTDLAGGSLNVINQGQLICSLTAASSQATTAGRVKPQELTGATSLLANEIQNRLGYAMSAKVTTNTNADLLVDVRHW